MRQRNRRIHFQTFHIDIFSDLEEYPGGFAEVSESDVEQFIEGEDEHILLFRLKKVVFYVEISLEST